MHGSHHGLFRRIGGCLYVLAPGRQRRQKTGFLGIVKITDYDAIGEVAKQCSFFRNPTGGVANIEWKPSTVEKPYYLKIDEDLQLIPGKILEKRLTFWNEVLTVIKYQS